MTTSKRQPVAAIGAGIAGATGALALTGLRLVQRLGEERVNARDGRGDLR